MTNVRGYGIRNATLRSILIINLILSIFIVTLRIFNILKIFFGNHDIGASNYTTADYYGSGSLRVRYKLRALREEPGQ